MPTIRVLHSSFTGPVESGFSGYCFSGLDYIHGAEGAREYVQFTGRPLRPGADGCYVTVNHTPAGIEFGADAAGMAKLFYYDVAGVWAVSNSLAALVDHLRQHGVRLTPNFPQLHAMSWGATLTKQVSAFSTMFNEIRLMPSTRKLVLTSGGLKERPLESALPELTYSEALESFIATWTSRLGTLLQDSRVRLRIDLTGGVDSRAIFAMARTALTLSEAPPEQLIFNSGTGARWKRDLDVAKAIAERYGVLLNTGLASRGPRLSGADRFDRWREVCLGVYLPVYLHDMVVDPFDVHINGGGGENHRHFYPAVPADEFLDEFRPQSPSYLYGEWRRDIEEALDLLVDETADVAPLILHYREFRNRFHTGRPPLYRTGFAPLTTTLFHRVAMTGGITKSGQLNFDIMASLIPDLLDLPYDDPDKAPSAANRRNITVVKAEGRMAPGAVYVGSQSSGPTVGSVNDASPMQLLGEAATRALDNPAVTSFASPTLVKSSREVIGAAVASGSFEHATRAKGISFLLAADFALGS